MERIVDRRFCVRPCTFGGLPCGRPPAQYAAAPWQQKPPRIRHKALAGPGQKVQPVAAPRRASPIRRLLSAACARAPASRRHGAVKIRPMRHHGWRRRCSSRATAISERQRPSAAMAWARDRVGVGRQADLVAVHDALLGRRSGVGGGAHLLDLRRQRGQRRELIFHLAHGGQRALAVAGAGGSSAHGLIDGGVARAGGVKQRLRTSAAPSDQASVGADARLARCQFRRPAPH